MVVGISSFPPRQRMVRSILSPRSVAAAARKAWAFLSDLWDLDDFLKFLQCLGHLRPPRRIRGHSCPWRLSVCGGHVSGSCRCARVVSSLALRVAIDRFQCIRVLQALLVNVISTDDVNVIDTDDSCHPLLLPRSKMPASHTED